MCDVWIVVSAFLFKQKQVQSTRNRKWGTTKSKSRVNGSKAWKRGGSTKFPEQKKVEKVAEMQHFDSGIAPHLNVPISKAISCCKKCSTYFKAL